MRKVFLILICFSALALAAFFVAGSPAKTGFIPAAFAAGNLVPPFDVAAVRARVGKLDKKAFSCPETPPPMRDLQFYSMYKSGDASKSTVDPQAYAAYKKAYQPIADFEHGLVAMANRYVKSSPARSDVAACGIQWLDAWAKGGALLGQVNKNGEYIRKWLIASVSNAYMQVRGDKSLTDAQRGDITGWIRKVGEQVQTDFSRDPDLVSRRNNHLYWAAWGAASAALATNDRQLFDWAMDKARFGVDQIQPDGTLPLEMDRGPRAFLYHLFASMPLFMLAEAGYKNGVDLFKENNEGLKRLGALNVSAMPEGDFFAKATGKKQDLTHVPSPSDTGWLEVYVKHYDNPQAKAALDKYRPVKHSRMGGNITLLYAGIVAKPAMEEPSDDDDSDNNN